MNYLKINGYDNFLRDPSSNSIINNSRSEYEEYISKRDAKNKDNQKIQKLENEIAMMKDDLSEIKMLIRRMVDGNESWNYRIKKSDKKFWVF